MSSQTHKHSKPTKPHNQTPQQQQPQPQPPRSSLSSHLAMVELKQRILTSLSKLSDRDTHQIAVEDLEKTIISLSSDAIPMILNCLYEASADPKPSVKKESIRLLTLVCSSHAHSATTHLTKIIAHVIRRLKDSDSAVRDTCRDAIGALAAQYLKGDVGGGGGGDNGGIGSVVALFVKPLFEAMGEQNKTVQAGAAVCMAKMVESAADTPVSAFHKMCPRICKLLNNPNFMAKAAMLPVVASLSQVGAIAPQSLEHLLPSIHDCLTSTDWATRKAAAEALSSLALHSSSLITDRTASTLTVLESCRFDKIKPVRDSMNEALQLWKKIAGKGDGSPDDSKTSSRDGENPEPAPLSETSDPNKVNVGERKSDPSIKDSPTASSNMDSTANAKAAGISEKAVVILKKKPPVLTDRELNPEFFQKLERRGSDDMPVEVVVPRRCLNSSSLNNKEECETSAKDSKERINSVGNIPDDEFHGSSNNKSHIIDRGNDVNSKQRNFDDFAHERYSEKRVNAKELRTKAYDTEDRNENGEREGSTNVAGFSKTDGQSEASFSNNKGNWLAIQRQLMLLERQQVHLMNMLQDFMGGSHDSMVTLENRVRGLERIVEDMARDLSLSSGHRGSNFTGFEGSSSRPSGKYNGFNDYSGAKYGRGGDVRMPFGERFSQSDGNALGMRGRGPSWRSDLSEGWDFSGHGASRNGQISSRRAFDGSSADGRSPKSVHESDQGGSRRAWDKAAMPIRFGEGPSARSVWQASKDEATLEAIRVAGEDSGTSQATRVPMPEMTAEAMADDSVGQERDAIWTSWSNAMHALRVGDIDSAFAEVLSTADDLLLVKLMDRTGPVIDQLSSDIVCEILHAIGQFLLDQNLYDICLSWIQQLVEIILEHGPDAFGIPMETKKELLLNLHEASTDTAEEWEGVHPDRLLMHLASAWEIDLQHDK
ncbi:PREDICTED: microtubule-associated protein TORTIFOLIA1-like [Lupinus angustifolius]|uniref:microtubule-associated protein TORTIFOLIA1-like n=1 Tax=Lupinus angustifolius TaxID=3871 RepID=UPI00092E425E|nr:PREDICTED: microtubule-associated protein TORTIFOLIA1-like [Lupinus angustifolius]